MEMDVHMLLNRRNPMHVFWTIQIIACVSFPCDTMLYGCGHGAAVRQQYISAYRSRVRTMFIGPRMRSTDLASTLPRGVARMN